jgi:putative aminopeptidase FrvX
MAKMIERNEHEQWLRELTMVPTAAGREQRVIAWVKQWVDARSNLKLREDKAGNLLITRKKSAAKAKAAAKPVFITAHLDHPAFVVREVRDDETIELEFRGGVNDRYFENAPIEIIDSRDQAHDAVITQLDSAAKPFKRVLARANNAAGNAIHAGDVARWKFEKSLPHVDAGNIYTHACDDLAAVAAALATLDELRTHKKADHVGVLLTRAEEVGFIGAIAACKHKSVPKSARLICLENSRSFAESPIGGGPIVRVGDRMSVFEPNLTNQISLLMMEHQKSHPDFKWQRKLMPGGTCEATTFTTFGYQSTCICLPLGNYHNMSDIDEVSNGRRPAKVAPEFISLDDFHGMIELLMITATQLDSAKLPSLEQRMNALYKEHAKVLRE